MYVQCSSCVDVTHTYMHECMHTHTHTHTHTPHIHRHTHTQHAHAHTRLSAMECCHWFVCRTWIQQLWRGRERLSWAVLMPCVRCGSIEMSGKCWVWDYWGRGHPSAGSHRALLVSLSEQALQRIQTVSQCHHTYRQYCISMYMCVCVFFNNLINCS